jgi:hypothetical protein
MVRGLDIFKEHFNDHLSKFVLIGGTACDLLMDQAGLDFRATRDLDIVLTIEALDQTFVESFWQFIELAGYRYRQQSTGHNRFYRFYKPEDSSYPYMLELFSKKPDWIDLHHPGKLTPIPVNEDLSSLSAILLDPQYYSWIQQGITVTDGLQVVGAEHLIPLKMRAWLDLTSRKAAGENLDSKVIRKHKNDVFRLVQLVVPAADIEISPQIQIDIRLFMEQCGVVNLKSLGVRDTTQDEVMDILRQLYRIDKREIDE